MELKFCLPVYFRSPNRVAGAGIEPASGGYEPPEVPLLYPAKSDNTGFIEECN